jgi:hypothetical protein
MSYMPLASDRQLAIQYVAKILNCKVTSACLAHSSFNECDALEEALMSTGQTYSSDVAFTPSVKAVQTRKGSRRGYQRMEERGAWQTRITPELAEFIEAQASIFLATVNAEGQPYIQHRGGPAGFLRVLDDKTIGFADFTGNRQYITQGNLAENPKAHLFLILLSQN